MSTMGGTAFLAKAANQWYGTNISLFVLIIIYESGEISLFKLDQIIVLSIVKLLWLRDIRIRLQYLINPLFKNAHVGHHINLSDSLRAE